MARLREVASAELTRAELEALRRLLDQEFGGRFSEDDWAHTLGGRHIVALDGHEIIGHAAVVPRTLVGGERSLYTGYVEGVATRSDRRRQGLATLVMRQAGRIIEAGYQLGALGDGTGIAGFYQRLGWEPWQGPTWVAAPHGRVRTAEEDGSVLVLRGPTTGDLDLTTSLVCDWRSGDVW